MDERIIIIDGNSLINRAYYAMQRPMITKEGIYTQGIFGFINMLNKLEKEYEPGYIAVAFDRKAPTFRHIEYDEYKAGRKKMPPELAMQMPLLKEVLLAMNIKCIEMDGWEADDLIGTIAKAAEENGLLPLVITGDKDALQLSSEKTSILITKKGVSEFKIYNKEVMMEEYGLTPSQFIDLKGLMGDSSDNIPGIPGVGEKTALKLLHEYGSVENVLASVDDMPKNKLREKLENNSQLAVMSKMLATINVNVPIEIDFNEFKFEEPDYDKLIEIYKKLEFNSFLKKLKMPENVSESISLDEESIEITVLDSVEPVKNIEGEIVIKVLSDNSHISKPSIFGIGFLWNERLWYAPSSLTDDIVSLFDSKDIIFSGHDIKNDIYVLMTRGLSSARIGFDTAICGYVLNPSKSDYSLKTLAFEYFHKEIKDEKEEVLKEGQIDIFDDGSKAFSEYIRSFCFYALELKNMLEEKIKENDLWHVYHDIELPLIPVLSSMELYGIKTDKNVLNEIGAEISESMNKLTEKIYELSGEEFNINSPKQLGVILFEKLGLDPVKKTKTGYSTNAEVLEKLKNDHEIIPLIIEYRILSKLKGTYVDGLIPLIGKDERIHAHFMQLVAATGRLSCTEPNLQNIPIRYELGRNIRKAFKAEDDRIFLGADYSQIELRVLAHAAEDPHLIDSFNKGLDIHKSTAAKVLGISEDEVTPVQRSSAKAVNFGVIYGMSSFGLSTELGISRKEAEKYIEDYFSEYSKVKEYMDEKINFCKEYGFVKTLEGRKRYINEISASNYMTRQLGERLAMNTPIQGSAADIIKMAMINVYKALKDGGFKSKLILQIHDELIIETVKDEIEDVKKLLQENMEKAACLKVKLVAEVNEAEDWFLLK